jgi:predicted DNA binding protein
VQLVRLLVRHDCPFYRPVGAVAGLRVTHLCHRGREAILEAHGPSVDGLATLLAAYAEIDGEVLLKDDENPSALVRFDRCECCRRGRVIPTVEGAGNLYLPPSSYGPDGETYQFLAAEGTLDAKAVASLPKEVEVVRVGTRPLETLGFEESFLVPAGSLFRALTARQSAAIVAAFARGYYQIPRATSTEELASGFGISREAFDALLRKAERKLLAAVFPYLAGSAGTAASARTPTDP